MSKPKLQLAGAEIQYHVRGGNEKNGSVSPLILYHGCSSSLAKAFLGKESVESAYEARSLAQQILGCEAADLQVGIYCRTPQNPNWEYTHRLHYVKGQEVFEPYTGRAKGAKVEEPQAEVQPEPQVEVQPEPEPEPQVEPKAAKPSKKKSGK